MQGKHCQRVCMPNNSVCWARKMEQRIHVVIWGFVSTAPAPTACIALAGPGPEQPCRSLLCAVHTDAMRAPHLCACSMCSVWKLMRHSLKNREHRKPTLWQRWCASSVSLCCKKEAGKAGKATEEGERNDQNRHCTDDAELPQAYMPGCCRTLHC